MIQKTTIVAGLLLLLTLPLSWAQERAIRPVETNNKQAVDPNLRQALVIGNSEYRHAGRLRNPVNDAQAIGRTLQQLGFEVRTLVDADQRQMERAIRDFGDQLRQRRGVGLFYYAGHGMQFDGENYLLPTDINPGTEEDVRYDAVPLGKMLAQMRAASNKMNVVILDACRNNPFSRSFRTFSPGLAQINAAAGTFISFATAPGQVAADGDGNHGLFTSKLLDHLQTPGLKIEEVFKRTTADVYTASNERQAPWVQYSVIGDFFFVPKGKSPQVPNQTIEVVLSGELAWKKLLATKVCVGCDLREAKLSGADLLHADLSEANLSNADLSAANLRIANLNGADLSAAKLSNADLSNADLSNADLSAANLRIANLNGANLRIAKLSGADLSNANLENANLFTANLRIAKLSNAFLWGAKLRFADLSGADLGEAKLLEADLLGADLGEAKLSGAYLCKTQMPDGSLNNRDC